jgi:hypothetical protein
MTSVLAMTLLNRTLLVPMPRIPMLFPPPKIPPLLRVKLPWRQLSLNWKRLSRLTMSISQSLPSARPILGLLLKLVAQMRAAVIRSGLPPKNYHARRRKAITSLGSPRTSQGTESARPRMSSTSSHTSSNPGRQVVADVAVVAVVAVVAATGALAVTAATNTETGAPETLSTLLIPVLSRAWEHEP